ncbi:MAG TPA: hypothetical protein VG012_05365 [Acidimicrobiia bacterium]|jgi:hypothetical protein|nr:hypothetical protein [Acidimicrobiia bacterium]
MVRVAQIVVRERELVVQLSRLEKLGALHADVRVPLSQVVWARVVEHPWSALRGLRLPGTGIPGVVMLGTKRGRFGADFAAVYKDRPAVAVELRDAPFQRLLVTVDDAAAVARSLQPT